MLCHKELMYDNIHLGTPLVKARGLKIDNLTNMSLSLTNTVMGGNSTRKSTLGNDIRAVA
jgi:hypothetical protein